MTSTTSRLLQLLSLLQARRDWPGGLLAERLDISHRTVRRDVDRLRELGYRIRATKGPDGGYRLEAGNDLPPLLFDDDQIIALSVALQSVTAAGAGVEEAALRALTMVRQVMPARLQHRLDVLRFTMLPARGSADQVGTEILIALSAAVRAREVVRFSHGEEGESRELTAARRVEPHHLVARAGRWYLVGWDLDRDDWRLFRADRIALRMPGGARFSRREVPGGSVADFVAARFRGSESDGSWPCRGSVVMNLPAPEVLAFAGEGSVEDLSDGRSRLTTGSWSWEALAASFGPFDVALQEVEPAQLRAAFAVLAERFAAAAAATQSQ